MPAPHLVHRVTQPGDGEAYPRRQQHVGKKMRTAGELRQPRQDTQHQAEGQRGKRRRAIDTAQCDIAGEPDESGRGMAARRAAPGTRVRRRGIEEPEILGRASERAQVPGAAVRGKGAQE